MRRSCSKRRLKVAAHRRRRLRCVAFCAHVRYRDPSTVEANRADCNGRSPHMRTRVPPAIVRGARSNSWRSRFARFVRARGWGLGDWRRDRRRSRRAPRIPPGPPPRGPAANFYQKKMNTGVSAGTAITTTDGRRSKARPNLRPNEGGSRREREDVGRYTILYARGGRAGVYRTPSGHASGHASGQRTHDIVQRTRVQHRARHGGHVLHAWASR